MRKMVVLAAALGIGAAMVMPAAHAATSVAADAFDRASAAELGGADQGGVWTATNLGFGISGGRAYAYRGSANIGYATLDPPGMVANRYTVEADVTTSPTFERAAPALTANWRDKKNQLFTKIEVTAGHPTGFLALGDQVAGTIHSTLCERSALGLRNGTTYHLALTRSGNSVTASLSDTGGTPIASCGITLSSRQLSAFGSATGVGLRLKLFFDEDDGGSRWDNLRVTSGP